MRRLAIVAALALLAPTAVHAAPLEIVVFLSSQRMMILENGETTHEFIISSGKLGKTTPTGIFTPQFLSRHHKSSLYDDAPMPNSIFYDGNYAIHGTYQESKLGGEASMGCIRLSVEDSKIPFQLVQEYGLHNTEVRIVG